MESRTGAIPLHPRARKAVSLLVVLAMTVSFLPSVFAEEVVPAADFGPGKYTADLIGGSKVADYGDVEVFNDHQNLYIDVTPDMFAIKDLWIYVGADPVPVNRRGMADTGTFTVIESFDETTTAHSVALDLKELGVSWGRKFASTRVLNVAVKADVVVIDSKGKEKIESTWASGTHFFDPKKQLLGQWFSFRVERPRKGHFIDAPVTGLRYATPTYTGTTDQSGAFLYHTGEDVTFSLAEWPIGSAAGAHRVTPLDLFQTADLDDPRVWNLARLLQSLDVEGTPRKRIIITDAVHDVLAEVIAEWEGAEDEHFEGFDFTDTEMVDLLIDGVHAKMAGVEGVTLVKVGKEQAIDNLLAALESVSYKFTKNVSKTPDDFTTKSRIELAPFYVPSVTSAGDETVIEYHDEYGDLIEIRDEARPIVMVYLDAHPDTGALDVWSAVSRDDGNTWKRKNLSRSADLSSFTLENGQPYYGNCEKPSLHIKDNKVMVIWTSKYAKGGSPRYSLPEGHTHYEEDIFGIGGPQRSTDYTYVEHGFPEIGEVPYNVVWTQRGVIDEATGAVTWYKPERLTSGRRNAMQLVLTSAGSGVGFAMSWQEDPEGIRPGQGKGSGVGWSGAIANHGTDIWYSYIHMDDFGLIDEDWESGGDRTGNPDSEWDADQDIAGRPKALVPVSSPVRITDNETINTDNIKVELDENGYPTGDPLEPGTWTPLYDEDGKEIGTHSYAYKIPGVIGGWHEMVNKQGVDKKVAITEDGRLLHGNTASTRAALFLQGYTKSDGTKSAWAILGYEKRKALGGGMPRANKDTDDPHYCGEDSEPGPYDDYGDHGEERSCWDCHSGVHNGRYADTQCLSCHATVHTDEDEEDRRGGRFKPDIGKNIVYHTFDWQNPDLVSGGTILNEQSIDPETLEPLWVKDEDGELLLDWKGDPIEARENARRPRWLVQGKSGAVAGKAATEKGTVMVLIYKQGEPGRGGPSDIFIQRWEVARADTGNPYQLKYKVDGSLNVSGVSPLDHPDYPSGFWKNPEQHPDDPDKGSKLVRWVQTEENLSDYSWSYAADNAMAHRGYLRGDLLLIGYTWTPNWRQARSGRDVYNMYVRRSFDGGRTFTAAPAHEPYNGVGVTWSEVFRSPKTGTVEEIEKEIGPGEFEPARNVSKFTNNRENVIEPRIVPPVGASMIGKVQWGEDGAPVRNADGLLNLAASPYPEDQQDFSGMWLIWGTGMPLNTVDADGEPTGKVPLDVMYTYSTDWGDTWVFEEKQVSESSPNSPGETEFRPFYLAKGVTMQGEAQAKLTADASKIYLAWNDEGLFDESDGHGGVKVEMDAFFRRIMPYGFEHNQAPTEPVTPLIR